MSTHDPRDDLTPALVREWLASGKLGEILGLGEKLVQEIAAWLAAIGA